MQTALSCIGMRRRPIAACGAAVQKPISPGTADRCEANRLLADRQRFHVWAQAMYGKDTENENEYDVKNHCGFHPRRVFVCVQLLWPVAG